MTTPVQTINKMPGITVATTDAAVRAWGIAKTLPRRILYSDVRSFLIITGELVAIQASTEPAAKSMMLVLDNFKDVDLEDPSIVLSPNKTIKDVITAQLQALVDAVPSLLSVGSMTAVLALGNNKISPFEKDGHHDLSVAEIKYWRGPL